MCRFTRVLPTWALTTMADVAGAIVFKGAAIVARKHRVRDLGFGWATLLIGDRTHEISSLSRPVGASNKRKLRGSRRLVVLLRAIER